MNEAAPSDPPPSARRRKFVSVFNRGRDSYQVPVGLHGAGLLEVHVTDFYAPDPPPRWWPRFLRRRRHAGLPKQRTHADPIAFLVQYATEALRLPKTRIFRFVDSQLARTAGRIARRRGAHLYCYHEFLPRDISDEQCLIVFVFHPLQQDYAKTAARDLALYPEVKASHELDRRQASNFSLPVPWTRPEAIVCASSVTARSVIAEGAPPERTFVIPYGLPETTRPVASLKQGGPVRFLFVGAGIQRKGIHHIVRAWQARPRAGAELAMVCYYLDPQVAAMVRDPSIRILGYQSREALDALFAESDVFIMPSLMEGFGLVYLEALSHGCHVIATPNTGIPDLGVSPQAATLVPPGNIEAIDSAIGTAIQRTRAGEYDRVAIAGEASRWTQADFARAIGEHAAAILAWRDGTGPYPTRYAWGT